MKETTPSMLLPRSLLSGKMAYVPNDGGNLQFRPPEILIAPSSSLSDTLKMLDDICSRRISGDPQDTEEEKRSLKLCLAAYLFDYRAL